MQDPNEDTEWNDALRRHNIIGPRQQQQQQQSPELTLTEQEIVEIVERSVHEKTNARQMDSLTVDELDELEDDEDERVLRQYRRKRLAEMMQAARAAKFGDVREISAEDYVKQVNEAGQGVWVVLHLYQHGNVLCSLINQHMTALAARFPATKFLRSEAHRCIANYPSRHLPTLFIYQSGQLRSQLVGPDSFTGPSSGANGSANCGGISCEVLQWRLHQIGAVSSAESDDTTGSTTSGGRVNDLLASQLHAALPHNNNNNNNNKNNNNNNAGLLSSDEDDW